MKGWPSKVKLQNRLPWICFGAIAGLHLLFLLQFFAPAISTPDANGYWAQGSLLFTRWRSWFKPECTFQYVGAHWLKTESGRYYSRYPPGLPVLVGLVYRLFGYKASVLVNPSLASLSLVGLYLLLRRMVGRWWGLAGVAALAVNPVFNRQALWCFSHMAVTCFSIWGLVLLLRWVENGRLHEAFVTGLLFGCIPTIRYPEVLLGIGAGVFMLLHRRGRGWLHPLTAALGGALPLIPLLIRNQMAFGAFYRTGYSLSGEQMAFGWSHFKGHLLPYIRELLEIGVGPFLPLGLIGMVVMFWERRGRPMALLLALLLLPLTSLYIAYYWVPSVRFLLPTFPCYIAAGLWAVKRLADEGRVPLKLSLIGLLLTLLMGWGWFQIYEFKGLKERKEILVRITDELERRTERGDVVIANRLILQHLDFVRRWRLIDREYILAVSRPFPVIRPPEGGRNDLVRAPRGRRLEEILKIYGDLDPHERMVRMKEEILKWAGRRGIYYVGDEMGIEGMQWAIGGSFELIARLPIPGEGSPGLKSPPPRAPFRMGMGFPPPMGGPMRGRGNEMVIAEWKVNER